MNAPRGIVWHWTGGTLVANHIDLAAYHYVYEGDGRIVRGKHRIRDNMRHLAAGDRYAAHTGGWNSFRIGLAVAGMRDYRSRETPGDRLITEPQVERMLRTSARFCYVFGWNPLDPSRLCTHHEVWTLHGVRGKLNHLKTDITYLPFAPFLQPHEVGPYLREWTRTLIPGDTDDE